MKTLFVSVATFAVVLAFLFGSTMHPVQAQRVVDSVHDFDNDRGPNEAAAIFAQIETWQKTYPSKDHVYVVTSEGIQKCFAQGPDDSSMSPCKAILAKREWLDVQDALKYNPDAEYLRTMEAEYRSEYLRLKKSAEYCGICGPTGPLGPVR